MKKYLKKKSLKKQSKVKKKQSSIKNDEEIVLENFLDLIDEIYFQVSPNANAQYGGGTVYHNPGGHYAASVFNDCM
jgi:hypothetical protein